MDLHKKGVFSMPVSDIEDPPPQFEGHVDIEEFWQSVDQEIVCRGFLQSNRENPCKVSPSYVKWAPWIGPLTRASKKVLNTEYAKLTAKKSVVEQADIDISEERLSSELMNLKVDALRKLVKECGVDSKGSKMDLLLRLREEMKTRSTYDKVFQKVWGASVHVNIPKDVDMADHCGEQCEALTMTSNLMPCRASWTLGVHHPLQEQLVNYVLDEDRPMNELIVKDGQTCLTRENFVSLGLRREMDSMVGNACFRLIKEIFQHQGKDVYIVDLHIPPTWLLPSSCDPFLCLPHDMPCLRRWWCTMLVENLEIEGHGRRFAHFTEQGIQMARGSLDPIFRIPRKRKYDEVTMEPVPLKPCKVKEPCRVESSPEGIGILQLPEEVLHKIFILVVLQDGNPAILTLALTCTHFWKIVREESFLKEAHFCWLDSVVNWNSFSEEYKRTYRIPYLISRCIQCDALYKDCEGFWGSGQRGKLQGFYSENDFAGYCCMDCFYVAGGTI
ncbi:unnamed protein product [Leuciscus chuanchicus]